jgi:hypothetical protein
MSSKFVNYLSRTVAAAGSRRGVIAVASAVLTSVARLPRRAAAGKRDRCKVRHSEREIRRFIRRAAKRYKQSKRAMLRVAECESNFDPCAVNRAGPYYGLYQYLKSTWKTTPYGNKDIFDPEAQAFATGWMWKEGRKDEWACQ